METIKDQLKKLPDGYRERALSNLYPEKEHEIRDSIRTALSSGFTWSDTSEGYTFWEEVCIHYSDTERYPLPPLPDKPRFIDKKGFKKIYDVCSDSWKEKILHWFNELLVKDAVRVEDSQYKAMRDAAGTSEQHNVLDEVFGVEKKKNLLFNKDGVNKLFVALDSGSDDSLWDRISGCSGITKARWINQHLTDYLNKTTELHSK